MTIAPRELWFSRLLVYGLFIALIIVLNPAIRGLLLFVDAVGWEVASIIAATQLRALLPIFQTVNYRIFALTCIFASFVAWLTLRRLPLILGSPLLLLLLLPALMFLPYGVECRLNRRRQIKSISAS